MDPQYRAGLESPESREAWFSDEQLRVQAEVNQVWPRRLGTTPKGMVRAMTTHSASSGVRYRWRLFRGRRDRLSDVRHAVEGDWPVAMLIGRFIPRHWVLVVDTNWLQWQCYEPSSGEVCSVDVEAVRRSRLSVLGYPRPFAFVLPEASTRSATS